MKYIEEEEECEIPFEKVCKDVVTNIWNKTKERRCWCEESLSNIQNEDHGDSEEEIQEEEKCEEGMVWKCYTMNGRKSCECRYK